MDFFKLVIILIILETIIIFSLIKGFCYELDRDNGLFDVPNYSLRDFIIEEKEKENIEYENRKYKYDTEYKYEKGDKDIEWKKEEQKKHHKY